MRPADIEVGKTYYNRGKGKTRRTVIAISEELAAPWHSISDRPDEPVVLYRQDAEVGSLYLRSFAAWAGGEVMLVGDVTAARPRIDTSKYDPVCEHNWALLHLAKLSDKAGRPMRNSEDAAAREKRLREEWDNISEFVGQTFTHSEIAAWYALYQQSRGN